MHPLIRCNTFLLEAKHDISRRQVATVSGLKTSNPNSLTMSVMTLKLDCAQGDIPLSTDVSLVLIYTWLRFQLT